MDTSDENLEESYSASKDEWLPSDSVETPVKCALSTSASSSQRLKETTPLKIKKPVQQKKGNRKDAKPNIAYKMFLKLKEQKLQNVKYLVRHVENEQDKKCYKLLNQEAEEVNDSQEPQSDFEDYE
ncbi:hypothetical protein FQA39_LY15236 [Lamprigera yunnana]|nr:hypothetical protein FQA39_LY15236 [Lamprigera yunnana]